MIKFHACGFVQLEIDQRPHTVLTSVPKRQSMVEKVIFLLKGINYFIIEANGGLNQKCLSICDVVVVAGLLNATFVIPIFHLNSVRRDSSKFKDIFAEDFFIHALKIVNLRIKFWSSSTCYLHKVLPKAMRIAPFSNRLAYAVPSNVQGLRCMANFEALRFSEPIKMLYEKMANRMVSKNLHSVSVGKYVLMHVRFEEIFYVRVIFKSCYSLFMDMVAFSRCEYDSGKEEKQEMDIVHERSRRGNFKRRSRVIRPGADRVEVQLCQFITRFLSEELIISEKYMPPLKHMFPRLESKDTLASSQELAPFEGLLSRLAALNYMVYFKRQMHDMLHHSDQKSIETKKPSGSLYTFPVPNCMCKQAEAKIENNNMSTGCTKILI
ncbi:hypothetical protein UlMin_037159 [Ulmus minor]